MAAAVNGTKAKKHVSSITVGGALKKPDPVPSTSGFVGDDRHFNLSVITDEPEKSPSQNGAHEEEDDLNPKFGTATLSKSAPVADIVKDRLASERQSTNLDEISQENGHQDKEPGSPSSDSTTSDEKSSHSSSMERPEPSGPHTSWTIFAQSYFQVKGSHSYLCAALQQPLLPKKEKSDHLASLAAWVMILRIMGDLPDSEYGDNIDVAGTAPPIITQVKQNFQKKYSKRDVDDAYKKYSELFKDPAHSEITNIPFLSEKVGSMLEKVQYVCGLGIYRPEIRDELYCQVCKQLTNNPSRNSTVRGWVLLHLLAGCFAPTEKFSSCFLQFLRESSSIFSCRVERLLRRTSIVGTRGYPPSWLEFQASKNGKPILIPMSMMTNQRMIVSADSATTVQELCNQVCNRSGLRDASGFSVYITLMQRISCLGHGMHRIMDAVAECEQHTKQMGMRESSSTWRLYFRKEYFTPWHDPYQDQIATELIYQQVMRGISVGEYKCDKDEVLASMAAKRYFCEFPGNLDATKLQTFLAGWLPENDRPGSKPPNNMIDKVMNILKNEIPRDKTNVQSLKSDIVIFAKSKWHSMFSRFYDASKIQCGTVTWQSVILGLNSKGLQIMDESEDVKCWITFLEITDVAKGRHSVTVSTLKVEDYVVFSNHSEDLFSLLSTFMDGLRRKSTYGLAVQDSTQIEGAIGVSLTKGDLVVLERPYEEFMAEDVYSATCKRTGKLSTMPRDLIYILPTVEEPAHDMMGMLTVQVRKDPSVFVTQRNDEQEHNLQMYAKLHFRQSNDNAVTKFLSKASFKSSKKEKASTNWQFQKDQIKKPLLRRTYIREELRRASCRSFLAIQQYMGDNPRPDDTPEMQIANESVIEPAMRSRHMRDEVYCQIMKQLTNNPDKSSEDRGWRLFFLLCTCAVPSTELQDECERFLKGSKHPSSKKCLERMLQTRNEGSRQYPPHPLEHTALLNKRQTFKITIGFPFQIQQEFEVDVNSRVSQIKRQIVDKYDLENSEEYGLCFGLKDRVISAPDNEYFLDTLTNVELFWLKQPANRSSVSEPVPSTSQSTSKQDVHVFFLKKLWVNIQPGQNKNADMMFHFPQEVPNYLRGYHNCSDKDAGRLAAFIYRAQFGEDMSALNSFEENIRALVPQPLVEKKSVQDWKQVIQGEIKSTKGMNKEDAKLAFLKVIHQWPTYGSVFFTVKQRSLKSYPKHVLFAVNVEGVMFLDVHSKNILARYAYSKIPNWAYDEQSFTLVVGEGTDSSKVYMETNLGHNMDDIIMSYVAWMMNTHIQKRPSYAGVTVGESMC